MEGWSGVEWLKQALVALVFREWVERDAIFTRFVVTACDYMLRQRRCNTETTYINDMFPTRTPTQPHTSLRYETE